MGSHPRVSTAMCAVLTVALFGRGQLYGQPTVTPAGTGGVRPADLRLTLLVKSAELVKQQIDIQEHTSALTPRHSSCVESALKRNRVEYELLSLRISHAKSEIADVEFDDRRLRKRRELAAIAKAEYAEAASVNDKVPNAISVPEINRLRLEWEVAALRVKLAESRSGAENQE